MHDYSKRLGKQRLRFRDWLIEKLNTKEIEGVQWIDRERGLFKIPWVHGSHQGWNLNDVEICRQWAIYSGKHEPSTDVPDPRKWKTNFRCTMNALRDFKEVRNESSPRGPRRFKIYRLESIGKGKKEQSGCEKEERQAGVFEDLTDKEIVQMVDEMMTPQPITTPALQKPLLVSRPHRNAAYPAFETLVLGKSTGMFPFPHTPWYLAAWNAMAVDQHVEKPELAKFADKRAEESGSQSTSEGIQAKRLVKRHESREIRNHERTFTEEELADAQEIIDWVDRMDADSDRPEESDEEEDEVPSDQEIIDLVDQMADCSDTSHEELDDTEESNHKKEEEPNDQQITDQVDQLSD